MITLTMREKLITYLADADDSRIADVYSFLKEDFKNEKPFVLSSEQLQWLNQQHELHLAGKTKSYTREEARQIIKGERGY